MFYKKEKGHLKRYPDIGSNVMYASHCMINTQLFQLSGLVGGTGFEPATPNV